MVKSTKQLFLGVEEEAKRVFRPRNTRDWLLFLLAVWGSLSILTLLLFGIHPTRTWVTFIAFFLPALICLGAAIFSGVVRLFNPRSQRYGMWMLFGKVSGSLWPTRILIIAFLLVALFAFALLIWGFVHL